MEKIKRENFMRVLDYLMFDGKYERALNDRVRIDFEMPFGSSSGFPCLAVALPESEGLEFLFRFTVNEVLLHGEADPLRKACQRAHIDGEMVLYFPGVTLED